MSIYPKLWEAAKEFVTDHATYSNPPTLEEIIKKCQACYPKKTPLELMGLMRIGISRVACSNYLNSCCMQELWLVYFMSLLYSKKWDNDLKKWYHYER